MKNKFTKMSIALLAIMASVQSVSAQNETPKAVLEATNTEFLLQFAKEKDAAFKKNYEKAVQIAEAKGMPISGEREGYSFSLVGLDEETGGLKYYRTFNNVEPGSSIQTANVKPFHEAGYTGAGEIIGVWDGGVGLAGHLAFTGGRYVIKDPNTASHTALGKDHAAHVAGTIAAGNIGSDTSVRGMAPGATIHAYNWTNDLAEMAAAAAVTGNKMYASNHSYGLDDESYYASSYYNSGAMYGQYNGDARDYDIIANNAPYYTIVFAAGNSRQSASTYNPGRNGKDMLSQGGVSKNTVVVAATKGTADFAGITGLQSVSGNNQFIAPFSNYGPSDDFRIKPDIAAKGVDVKSTTQTSVVSTATYDGTSMATPSVTGVFGLWQGYYKQKTGNYMLSSTVRGLMAHTAKEAGPANGPDFMFGWGVIDAGKGKEIIDALPDNTVKIAEFDLTNGGTFTYDFTYTGTEPLVATLSWNDPAGSAQSTSNIDIKTLVNDLDMRIINTDTNTTYYPWSLVRNINIAATSSGIAVRDVDNARDNIEKIEVNSTVPGNYRIVINHKSTLKKLQGNTLVSADSQKASLIITGAGQAMPDIDGQVSVEQQELDKVAIYPNPVSTTLYLSGDASVLSGSNVEIFDTLGKRVYQSNTVFQEAQPSIDVSAFSPGVYMVNISKDNAKNSYKFVKK